MNKQEYIEALRAELSGMNKSELSKTIEFYSELIDDALEDGVSEEEEAVAGLEQPETVAARMRREETADTKKRGHTVLFVIAIVLASPIWLPIAVSVIAVLFSVYISLWAVVISLMVSAAGSGVGAIAGTAAAVMMFNSRGIADSLFILGSALVIAGAAILLMYLSCIAAKYYIKLSAAGISWLRVKARRLRK